MVPNERFLFLSYTCVTIFTLYPILASQYILKNWNQSQKYFGLKKAYFGGHPVIQAVEAKMLRPFYEKLIFLQNISSLKNQSFLSITR